MNNRIGWIDLAKLMGIFLMVLCHGMVPATADNLIHAFHMPLFFVLSGWCFQAEDGRRESHGCLEFRRVVCGSRDFRVGPT